MFYNVLQVPLMDKAGRRPLLIIPMIVMIIDLVGMTICLVLQVRSQLSQNFKPLVIHVES